MYIKTFVQQLRFMCWILKYHNDIHFLLGVQWVLFNVMKFDFELWPYLPYVVMKFNETWGSFNIPIYIYFVKVSVSGAVTCSFGEFAG